MRKNPTQAVGKAVRDIRVKASEEYRNGKYFYSHLIAELGTDSAFEKQLLRVRHDVIGNTPSSRNYFDPVEFLERIHDENNDMIVCDSNDLEFNWRDQIENSKESSEFSWDRMNEDMLNIEKEFHNEEPESMLTDDVNVQDRDLPKRMLAYSTQKLLKE